MAALTMTAAEMAGRINVLAIEIAIKCTPDDTPQDDNLKAAYTLGYALATLQETAAELQHESRVFDLLADPES